MSCVAPIVVQHPETRLRSEVRCGQCRQCRLRRKLSWVGRLRLEARLHAASRFITLTYADDPGILDYEDFQLFMKRYREKFGGCRFFVVGEYGGKNKRGHYHAIIFGHPPVNVGHSYDLRSVWGKGFCYDGTVTEKSIGYVASYCFKENYAPGRVPFVRMSLKPGVGMVPIAQMARDTAALKTPILRWPSDYAIGNKRYPLCDGGLARWQTEYLESGGLPPPISNPYSRDLRARARASDLLGVGGSQLSEQSNRSFNLQKRYDDVQALKKDR